MASLFGHGLMWGGGGGMYVYMYGMCIVVSVACRVQLSITLKTHYNGKRSGLRREGKKDIRHSQ